MAIVIPTKARFTGTDVVALGEFESGDILPVDTIGTLTRDYTDSGAADAYILTKTATTPVGTAYVDGALYSFQVGTTNTGASTANVDGFGVKNIKLADGSDPDVGQLVDRVDLIFDTANDWLELRTFAGSGGPSLGSNAVIRTNAQNIAENITFLGTENGMTAGPITIDSTFTVTVTTGSTWTVV